MLCMACNLLGIHRSYDLNGRMKSALGPSARQPTASSTQPHQAPATCVCVDRQPTAEYGGIMGRLARDNGG